MIRKPAAARDELAALLPDLNRSPDKRIRRALILPAREQLALCTGQAGDPAGARDQYAALLKDEERAHGADHPETLATRWMLASCSNCSQAWVSSSGCSQLR